MGFLFAEGRGVYVLIPNIVLDFQFGSNFSSEINS